MDRRYLVVGVLALAALVLASFAVVTTAPSSPLESGQTYPPGAESDHINFSALDAAESNLTHTPRKYWDSYAIRYTAPPERRLVEGQYYINSTTGEIIAEHWHDAEVYRNGSVYVFFQPAGSIPEHQREQFTADSGFVYDNSTDAYYRYDPRYGQIAPTNIGRHTMLLDSYTWEATETTTHHGVPVISYRVTGTRTGAQVPPASNGTLHLGVEDGLIYAYDLTLDGDGRTYHYAYTVEPAPFPEHEWVATARDHSGNAT